MARMRELYVNEVAPALNKKFGYKSVMQIPKLDKIVVNVGCGEARDNQKMIDAIMRRYCCHYRSEALRMPGQEVGSELQAA